jgi:hypothetical protein
MPFRPPAVNPRNRIVAAEKTATIPAEKNPEPVCPGWGFLISESILFADTRPAGIGVYRLENWNFLRAPAIPYFLRSFMRGSRVSMPLSLRTSS